MRQLAAVQSISSSQFEQLKRTTRGATGGWVTETGTRAVTTTPKLGKLVIPTHEVYAEPHATQMLLDDSAINIEQWLADEIAEEFGFYENTAFINGTGAGQPRGLLTYAAGTADGQIEQVTSGDANLLTSDGLISLQTALKEPYQVNATWLMNRATVGAIRKLKASGTGDYMWQPGLGQGQPATLLGRPVVMGADMPTVAANALAAAYGDFRRAYKIVDRMGMRVLRDPFTAKPFIKFYSTKRVGGDVTLFEAVKIHKIAV
jgi:HK97 family phage major capsid protein